MGSKLNKQEESKPLLKSLDDNINMLKQSFSNSADLSIRQYEVDNTQTAVIAIEGMVNKEILADAVITPIRNGIYGNLDPKQRFLYIKDNLLSTSEQIEVETFEDVSKYIMSGFAVIAVDGYNHMLAIGIQGFSFRSISEPTSEVMQTGSKEGFVEALRINMTLVRRRIKNPKLKFETMSVGSLSKTDICLCYITDLVSEDILENIKSKINSIDLKTVLTSGYLMPYLEEKGDLSLFSSVGSSERPDTVCAKIA